MIISASILIRVSGLCHLIISTPSKLQQNCTKKYFSLPEKCDNDEDVAQSPEDAGHAHTDAGCNVVDSMKALIRRPIQGKADVVRPIH